MTRKWPYLLYWSAAANTAFLAVVVLLAVGALTALYEEHLYQAQRQTNLRETAEILAASLTAAVSFGDKEAAREYVTPLQVNAAIEAAGAYDRSGNLLAGFSRRGLLPEHLSADSPRLEPSVVVPVAEHGEMLGFTYLRASPEPLESKFVRYSVLLLLCCMAAIVVGGLASAQTNLRRQADHLAEANDRLQNEIDERAKAEDALRQSQKMEAIGQLSGGIAHDFNNLLMIIKGNLHLLKKRQSLPEDDRHLGGALEGIDRAASLTQRILSFSRRQALNPVPLDVNALIESMSPLIRSSLRENIEYAGHLDAVSDIIVDRNQLENVVLNLVINARDAMPTGGRLEIRTSEVQLPGSGDIPAGDYVCLAICDTGLGMTEEIRRKALEPFFTTKPIGQGTGLGLSTTYGFVTQSGGHIAIVSAPGKGTTVSIFLPRAAANANPERNVPTWRTS